MKAWKHGYTDALFNRPCHCPFSGWWESKHYMLGYLYGRQVMGFPA